MPFDIWLFSSTDEGELPLRWNNTARGVKGIELLVNIFTIVFLTELGSDLANPTLGTELGEYIGGNVGSSPLLFSDTVYTSFQQTIDIILEDQDETTPADETLVAASILDSTLIGDTLNVRVELESAAGSSREITIPTKTVI